MENEKEIADLSVLYDELANHGKQLAKDIRKSVDFYLLLGLVSLLLTFFSFAIVGGFVYYIWQGIAITAGWWIIVIFSIVSFSFLGFGLWLLRLYFGWKARYKNLLEMEKKWSKVDG